MAAAQAESLTLPTQLRDVWWIFLGAAGFVGLGFWFVFDADRISESRAAPELVQFIGLASIAFFGSLGIYTLLCCVPGASLLHLDHEGFTITAPLRKPRRVLWRGVTRIEASKASRGVVCYVKSTTAVNAVNIASVRYGMSAKNLAALMIEWRTAAKVVA